MNDERHNMGRFVQAQESTYHTVLAELRAGEKHSHWMWFIFPQIDGLGRSVTAQHYAIRNLDEALAYLAHPLLGKRLRECTNILLTLDGPAAEDIFGYPDVLKLRSSLTLFDAVSGGDTLFARVLNKYYGGERDSATLRLIKDNPT